MEAGGGHGGDIEGIQRGLQSGAQILYITFLGGPDFKKTDILALFGAENIVLLGLGEIPPGQFFFFCVHADLFHIDPQGFAAISQHHPGAGVGEVVMKLRAALDIGLAAALPDFRELRTAEGIAKQGIGGDTAEFVFLAQIRGGFLPPAGGCLLRKPGIGGFVQPGDVEAKHHDHGSASFRF